MRVLVTGGNGFIGSVVVRTLGRLGHRVRCLLRPTSKTHRLDGFEFERAIGDVRDAASVRDALDGCDGVIHLASLSSWDSIDSPEMKEIVLGGTKHVLAAAETLDCQRVVFVSSVTAVGATARPRSLDESADYNLARTRGLTYSHLKHRAEQLCRAAITRGGDVVIVNPAEVYGPRDTELVTAGNLIDFLNSNPVLVCNGGTSVAYVDDVALGIVRALERGVAGERYILGGPNLTLRELARHTLDIANKRARIVTVPNPVFRGITGIAKTLRIPLPYNPRVVPYATRYWFVDSDKAARELGVAFRSARDTLAPTISWLQQTGHVA